MSPPVQESVTEEWSAHTAHSPLLAKLSGRLQEPGPWGRCCAGVQTGACEAEGFVCSRPDRAQALRVATAHGKGRPVGLMNAFHRKGGKRRNGKVCFEPSPWKRGEIRSRKWEGE